MIYNIMIYLYFHFLSVDIFHIICGYDLCMLSVFRCMVVKSQRWLKVTGFVVEKHCEVNNFLMYLHLVQKLCIYLGFLEYVNNMLFYSCQYSLTLSIFLYFSFTSTIYLLHLASCALFSWTFWSRFSFTARSVHHAALAVMVIDSIII